jgi:hypothetical protein
MNVPSDEQQTIINSIAVKKNVIVDACAGSGKSTTILSCALAFPDKKFIQLTFNKQLQSEIQEKVKVLEIKNLNVYTFHGLAVKYYDPSCHNDMGIRRVLRESKTALNLPLCNVMVLDEAQDMTRVYFHLIWKFSLEINTPLQFLILGDEKQGLYGFKGSDTRFLTLGDLCWKSFPNLVSNEFVNHTLRTSYRITDPMCDFVNKVMLGEERMKSCKVGDKVSYYRRSIYDKGSGIISLFYMIRYLIREKNAKYEDFFVLCRSIKSSNSVVRILENLLVTHDVPCYIPNTDNNELDSRVIQNKVVFSTFHSAKGRQRPNVFVLGFDDTHFTYFAKDKDPNVCPNELYVACTRATKKLVVWENMSRNNYKLPFLKYHHQQLMESPFVTFNGIPAGRKPEQTDSPVDEQKKYMVTPSDLIRFLSESTLDIVTPLIEKIFITITPAFTEPIDIPVVHQTMAGNCEDVSDLNGIAIPLMYFDHLRDEYEPILQDLVSKNMKDVPKEEHKLLHDAVENMPTICETTRDYLYMANLFTTTQYFLYSRFKQISLEDYNWIPQIRIDECFQNLDNYLGEECKLGQWSTETCIINGNDDIQHAKIDSVLGCHLQDSPVIYRFTARVDAITQTSLWELKCTTQLTIEHKLQLVIYAWLYQMKHEGKKKDLNYYLFNIKTNELLQLQASLEQLTTIIVEIIRNKYGKIPVLSDEEFLTDLLHT